MLASAPQAAAQRSKRGKPQRVAYHEGTLEAALKEAKERNAGLLIVCAREGEEANDRFREALRDNSNLAQALQGNIVVLVNNGTHELKSMRVKDERGKTREVQVCEAYHTSSCEVHKRNWDEVYQTFIADIAEGEWALPSALIIKPSGERHSLIATGEPPSNDEMLRGLKVVRAKAGPSLSLDELKRVKSLTLNGKSTSKAGLWPDAWRAWNSVLEITDRSSWSETASRGRTQAAEGLAAQLKRLGEATGDANAAYPKLAWFALDTRGTPVEKQAAKLVKDARRAPEFDKVAAKVVDLEIEAEGLLRQAQALLDEGDAKGAGRALKKLMSKKYRDTPAQAEGKALQDRLDD